MNKAIDRSAPVFRINHLVKEFGPLRAVDDVSAEIFHGEAVFIIGPSGSGKSTFLRCLNLLEEPTSGEILFKGRKINAPKTPVNKFRQQVGMVFQNPDNQMIASIVEDDIAFGPENLGVPREEIVERVEGALESVGMSEYHDKTPTKLSGGQKQRIAIAGVLAIRPRVLVLDEATSMLDPQGRKDVMDTVKRLNREGITVVAITHFMDEVTEADRVAVLSEGELVMQGAPREIFKEKDKLHGYGLDVPRSVALSHELFSAGLEIEPAIFDVDELGDEICRLLSDN